MHSRPYRNSDDQKPRITVHVLINRDGERRHHRLEDITTGLERIQIRSREGLRS